MVKRIYTRRLVGSEEYKILSEISAGDLFVGMLLSARSTRVMYKTARERAMRRQMAQRTLERLSKKGLIKVHDGSLHLTPAGKLALDREVKRMRSNAENGRLVWDGKWRLISFDVPEEWRVARNTLRLVLKKSGFMQLQQSVWAYPYDCSELEILLAEDERLIGRVLYARVEAFSDERMLLGHFKLRRPKKKV